MALKEASERVRARYGFACTRTDEEAIKLQKRLAMYGRSDMVDVRGNHLAPPSAQIHKN